MIDISVETPAALRLAAQFFIDHAALKEATEGALRDATPAAPAAPLAPLAPPAPSNVVPFVPAAASPAAHTHSPMTAAVAPLPPMPPLPTNAPAVATPGTPSISSMTTDTSVVPALPGASVAPPAPDQYDSLGVPFDARIHQKKMGQKKDGSWKLQKGIADALVSSVMQELAPRIRKGAAAPAAPPAPPAPPADVPPAGFGTTPLPAGATAPVSLPPVPPFPGQAQAPAAPPAPVETIAQALDPFRALVKKVTEARTAKRITAEEVVACAAQAGVPGIQALNAMPHLVATVEANIDALLATR